MIGEKLKKTFAMLERRGVSPGDIEKKMNAAEAEAKRALQRGFQAIEEAKEMLERLLTLQPDVSDRDALTGWIQEH